MTSHQVTQATLVRAVSSAKPMLGVAHSAGYRVLVTFMECVTSSHRRAEVELHILTISVPTTERHETIDLADTEHFPYSKYSLLSFAPLTA